MRTEWCGCWQCVWDHQAKGIHQLGDWYHGVHAVQRYSQEPASHLRSLHLRQGQLCSAHCVFTQGRNRKLISDVFSLIIFRALISFPFPLLSLSCPLSFPAVEWPIKASYCLSTVSFHSGEEHLQPPDRCVFGWVFSEFRAKRTCMLAAYAVLFALNKIKKLKQMWLLLNVRYVVAYQILRDCMLHFISGIVFNTQ